MKAMADNGSSEVHIIFKHRLRIHGQKFLSDKRDQTPHVQTCSPGREWHLPAQQKHQDQRKWVTTHFPRISMKQKGQQVRLTAAAINVKSPETGWHIACVLSAFDDSYLHLLMLTDYLIEPRHKPSISKHLEKWRSPRFDVADTYKSLVRKTKLAKDTPNHSHRRKSHPLSKPQHTKD